ncbi:sensor histidine kinase [Sulfurospirillum diekertiae]|uniref:sensor histidine kinase n=1 Tax=Sulfurospirillum diekertiae TaxID=1854492 RepID=UPI000DC72FBE|nr:HAMP domain-containing sensor histidine kinase [Sulfurospirillum diekertiae]ASC92191.1 Signal transduction histidine-protein kinase/phosphatase MprB [Sulfurospirillum diekertiae]
MLATSLIIGYLIVSYTLSSLFKTNRFLDILLKDTLHELNIPLSVINANLQMLQADEQDVKKLKRLERIELASKDLYALYKEVDYYIKKEIQEDVREKFYLDELVDTVVQKQKEMANGVDIFYNILHVELFADKHGLAKVISNLVHNALKYNQNHKPLHIFQEEETLVIKDQGIGMSEAELFLAFNRYYQADTTKEGYGIGLSLVKAYCDEFKIAMRINSQKNVGTEVILDIAYLLNKK